MFNTICAGNTTRNGTRDESTIDIELYYTANSQKDADFVVSQLAAELKDPQYPHLIELALSSGGGITIDENGNCQAETSGLCETSLLHVSGSVFELLISLLTLTFFSFASCEITCQSK